MTVRAAFTFLCSQAPAKPGAKVVKPGYAIDFTTVTNEQGQTSLDTANTVSFEDWVKLPVREGDLSIQIGPDPVTGAPRSIRVPLVVICSNYEEVPKKRVRWSPAAVRNRDKGVCQVSKRKLAPGEGNTGHIIARSKGGKDTFENTIYMDKKLNTIQGTKTPEEMGWNVSKPKAPKEGVKVLTAEDAKHPSQLPFLI